jgi:hypothetical protein
MLRSGADSRQEVAESPSDASGSKPPRIRCPKCRWQPRKHDRWQCRPECRHVWNTFDTRGVCPACGYQWTQTACPRCREWSPHADWYAAEDPA